LKGGGAFFEGLSIDLGRGRRGQEVGVCAARVFSSALIVYVFPMRLPSRLLLAAAAIGGAVLPPTPLWAQDLSTCSGNYDYCVELARRAGRTPAHCEAAYQQCMRTGTSIDYYNPRNYRRTPVERK
jgi:hypothetical protein